MNSPFSRPDPRNSARQRLPDVTIAIAFTCKDGIVVASDSQMSAAGTKYKQPDEPKVSSLAFAGDHHAILAISGALDGARSFQQVFEEVAFKTEVLNRDSIANAAEVAIKQTRSRMLEYVDHRGVTSDERREHLAQQDFEVLLAYYFDGTPFVYSLKLANGIAIKGRHPYEAIGCGSDIAGVILTGTDFKTYLTEEVIGLAFYTVEACKKFDQACGGKIQHLILGVSGKEAPAPLSERKASLYQQAVRKTDEDIQLLITQSIYSGVHEAYRKMLDEMGI